MKWYEKAWEWTKEHWYIVVGALGAIIGGFLVFGSMSRKVDKLKDAVKVEKALSDVKRLEAKSEQLVKQESAVAKKDEAIAKKIIAVKKQAVKVREDVDTRSDQEIADRFNELYR